jgi:U32 family peptidase
VNLRTKPEIMAPAGGWPQLRAAVEAGADAVYFGLQHFTARAKVGFGVDELPEVMRTLHGRGVKGYVTFNTLVFDEELDDAARHVGAIAAAGADAIIVQDAGIVPLIREIAPGLAVHGSTQMTLTSAEGVRWARELGVSRVILARELSLEDVRSIRADTDMELEIFVHGALCVSYSGQCLSSEAWGGRSANRGQCAQACRLPYDLLVDGTETPLGDARYLLSPGDLNTLRMVPDLVALGLHALKIEGRYKDETYVAVTTRAYREAVDAAWAGRNAAPAEDDALRVEQVYSRGSGAHFLSGVDHQAVVRGRVPRHRGVCLGRVLAVGHDSATIEPGEAHRTAPLSPGDGVVFDAADWRSPERPEEGGRVYEVERTGAGALVVRFARGAIDFGRIRAGDLLWRSHDPRVDRFARPFTRATAPVRRQRVDVDVTASPGSPLVAVWRLAADADPDAAVTVCSPEPLEPAARRPLDVGTLRGQFGRLGSTPYELGGLTLDMAQPVFAPVSLLNELRREAVETLVRRQEAGPARDVREPAAVLAGARARDAAPAAVPVAPVDDAPHLHLLVRTPEQLDAALDARPASITLDYLDLYGLRPSVDRVRGAGLVVRVAGPRVLKPGEDRIANFLRKLDGEILVRSTGLLHSLSSGERPPLTGDAGLNAANVLTARSYLSMGLARITPGHDLNAGQVAALARAIGAGRVEVVAYHHVPVFHTEHCVFARFLSNGTSWKDCGRPCEHHRVELRDPDRRTHPVLADVGCRNTVFGAEAQEASRHLDAWRDAGIRHFRLEFAHESADDVTRITAAFAATLAGARPAAELGRNLAAIAPGGTTEGSLFVPAGAVRGAPTR